jgi:superfamily II DNA or RNA helicase
MRALDRPSTIPTIFGLASPGQLLPSSGVLLQSSFISGQLAIKVARPKNQTSDAIYHEKLGVIVRPTSPSVCFEGSANESRTAYLSNFERIVAHEPNSLAARRIDFQFETLWSNETAGLDVRSFLEALRAHWLVLRRWQPHADATVADPFPPSPSARMTDLPVRSETLLPPAYLQLRPYQQAAVTAWFGSQGTGVLEMATGTGKTFTALSIATRLYRELGGPLVVIVVAPLLHLVDQWIAVARDFGLSPVRCAGSSASWVAAARDALYACNNGSIPVASLAVSMATFSGVEFQRILVALRVRTLLVVDEVHNAGSAEMSRALPENISLRLGLSATPVRHGDDAGTDRIRSYFGDVVFRFGIAEALAASPPVLTPYLYEPILVHLDSEETEEYLALTMAIVRLVGASDDFSDWPLAAQYLLIKRARLIAGCRAKIPALRTHLSPYQSDTHTLVYCGDGKVTLRDLDDPNDDVDGSDTVVRQIDAVTQMIGLELGMSVKRYTAHTLPADRRILEQQFLDGSLQALVAIRCLDEGVDLPATRRAFILASSTNPRQFIQRRGRVLRRAPGKEHAEIFDFIVLPPLHGIDATTLASIKGLFRREMSRVVEFASTATNRFQALDKLLPALEQFGLQHLLFDT